jgi:hypothetical protein
LCVCILNWLWFFCMYMYMYMHMYRIEGRNDEGRGSRGVGRRGEDGDGEVFGGGNRFSVMKGSRPENNAEFKTCVRAQTSGKSQPLPPQPRQGLPLISFSATKSRQEEKSNRNSRNPDRTQSKSNLGYLMLCPQ